MYRTAIIKSAIYSVIFLISTYIWKLFYGIHIYPFTWNILLIIYKNVHSRRNKKIEVTIILNFIELHFSIDWCETTYRRCRYLSVSLSVYPLGKNCWRTSQCHLAQRERERHSFFQRVLARRWFASRAGKQIIVGAPKIFIRPRCTRHHSFGKHLNRPNKRQRKHNALY